MRLVTIITINYNNSQGLDRTIRSVQKQTHKNIEHIIVDGASTDGSVEILQRYSNEKSVSKTIIIEPDRGIYDAMNKGLEIAGGEYVSFLNSGDIYNDNKTLETIMTVASSSQNSIIYCNLKYYDYLKKRVCRRWKPQKKTQWKYYLGWMTPHPSTFIPTNLYRKYGNFNLELKIAADYELMLRFMFIHRLRTKYVDLDAVIMETGGVSNGKLKNIITSNLEVLKAWAINGKIPPLWIFLLKPLSKIFQ